MNSRPGTLTTKRERFFSTSGPMREGVARPVEKRALIDRAYNYENVGSTVGAVYDRALLVLQHRLHWGAKNA